MGSVVDETDTGIEVIVASIVVGGDIAMDVTEAMLRVEIAVQGILLNSSLNTFMVSLTMMFLL